MSYKLRKQGVREDDGKPLIAVAENYRLRIFRSMKASRPIFSMGNLQVGMATVEVLRKLGHRVTLIDHTTDILDD